MKVDGLGIIGIIILLPIILVVSLYIKLEMNTISKENTYNTKLLDATVDAMEAFEINTANEELSTVSDSMRSIIEASNNTFLGSLATNMGMSNASTELIQPYIPSVLYTMYDGYYIYAPTQTPVIAEKSSTSGELVTTSGYYSIGNTYELDTTQIEKYNEVEDNYGAIIYEADTTKSGGYQYTTDLEKAKYKTDYVLKPYTQYSGRYKNGNIDVTINYTLDNYLNIEGTIGDIYYTKTGYLLKNNMVTNITINGKGYSNTDIGSLGEDEVKEAILGNKTNTEETTTSAANSVSVKVNGVEISANWSIISAKVSGATTISDVEEALENGKVTTGYNDVLYEVQKYRAIAYYATSACFSSWVYNKLGDLTYGDIQEEIIQSTYDTSKFKSIFNKNDSSNLYYQFAGNTTKIFNNEEDPEATTSAFYTHKLEVIKNSIKYNLNMVISAYANSMNTSYQYSLPVLSDTEWDRILNNISIVSFMQGLDCGLDVYNNYQIVSSTNNELTVTPSEIYYVNKEDFNSASEYYHRIDCEQLLDNLVMTEYYISFKSKEVKYDKIYNSSTGKYEYDHKNLACYECINTNNDKDRDYTSYYGYIDKLSTDKKLAGYIGLAYQRQKIYKTNALLKSEGYVVKDLDSTSSANRIQINETETITETGMRVVEHNNIFKYSTEGKSDTLTELEITLKRSNVSLSLANGTVPDLIEVKIECFIDANQSYITTDYLKNQPKAQTLSIKIPENTKNVKISIKNIEDYMKNGFYYGIESVKEIYKGTSLVFKSANEGADEADESNEVYLKNLSLFSAYINGNSDDSAIGKVNQNVSKSWTITESNVNLTLVPNNSNIVKFAYGTSFDNSMMTETSNVSSSITLALDITQRIQTICIKSVDSSGNYSACGLNLQFILTTNTTPDVDPTREDEAEDKITDTKTYALSIPKIIVKNSKDVEKGTVPAGTTTPQIVWTNTTRSTLDFSETTNNSNVYKYAYSVNSLTGTRILMQKGENKLEITAKTSGITYYVWTVNQHGTYSSSYTAVKVRYDGDPPSVSFTITNVNRQIWTDTTKMSISIIDKGSGMATGTVIQYGWSDSKTTEPKTYTTYTFSGYSSGANTISTGNISIKETGKRYLWIKPKTVKDVAGNELTDTLKSNSYYIFDGTQPNTGPNIVVRAENTTGEYKGIVRGSTENVTGEVYTNSETNYLIISGGYVKDGDIASYAYSTSPSGTKTDGNKIKVTATTDGVTYYAYTKDKFGNYSSVYTAVEVVLDKTAPNAPNLQLYGLNNNGTKNTSDKKGSVISSGESGTRYIGSSNACIEITKNNEDTAKYAYTSGSSTATKTETTGDIYISDITSEGATYYVWAIDQAGNESSNYTTITVIKDDSTPTAPVITVNYANEDKYVINDGSQLIVITTDSKEINAKLKFSMPEAESGITYWVSINNDKSNAQNNGSELNINITSSTQKYYVWSKNNAGNYSAGPTMVKIVLAQKLATQINSASKYGNETNYQVKVNNVLLGDKIDDSSTNGIETDPNISPNENMATEDEIQEGTQTVNNLDVWKVFYNTDKDGGTGQVVLIYGDYLPNSTGFAEKYGWLNSEKVKNTTYCLLTNYDGMSEKLSDSNSWKDLVCAGMPNETKAYGSVDIDTWINSWNQKHNTSKSYIKNNKTYGFEEDKLYFPYENQYKGCNGYRTSTKSTKYSATEYIKLIGIICNDGEESNYIDDSSEGYTSSQMSIRPVIYLSNDARGYWDKDYQKWILTDQEST